MQATFRNIVLSVGVVATLFGGFAPADAQVGDEPQPSYGLGVDVANRYVWRGLQLNDDLTLHPYAWAVSGLLQFGTWGAHSAEGEFHEQDFWLTYFFPGGPAADISLTVTDYYINPEFGDDFFDFRGVGACPEGTIGFGRPPRCARGAHTVEVTGLLSSNRRPFDLLVAYNFHNDPEDSVYLEGTLRPVVAGFQLKAVAGGVAGRSENYYGTDGAEFVNLGAGIGRSINFGMFRLPLSAEVVHNPVSGETYYVARGGLGAAR